MLPISKHRGTGGEIKVDAESFVVEEITKNGTILEVGKRYGSDDLGEESGDDGKFARLILEKCNWNTIQALREIAKRFHRGTKSVGYCGMKDRLGRTVQLASIFGVKAEALGNVKIKDVSINGCWQSKHGVETGELLGNHFKIRISNPDNPDNAHFVIEELGGKIPNYFDKQRFGSRLNNHKIGLSIIKGDFEGAAMEFLVGTENETNNEAVEARKRLKDEMDFRSALEYFPSYLKYERAMIDYLARYENAYSNALMKLPRGILVMFVHAVEDIIFNYSIDKHIGSNSFGEAKIRCGYNFYGFPDILKTDMDVDKENSVPLGNLVGYETREDLLFEYEKDALERLGITPSSFKLRSMPELSMKGTTRPLLANFKDMKIDDSYENFGIEFSLPAGSYATVLTNEVTKSYGAFIGAPDLGRS